MMDFERAGPATGVPCPDAAAAAAGCGEARAA